MGVKRLGRRGICLGEQGPKKDHQHEEWRHQAWGQDSSEKVTAGKEGHSSKAAEAGWLGIHPYMTAVTALSKMTSLWVDFWSCFLGNLSDVVCISQHGLC